MLVALDEAEVKQQTVSVVLRKCEALQMMQTEWPSVFDMLILLETAAVLKTLVKVPSLDLVHDRFLVAIVFRSGMVYEHRSQID